MLVAKTQGLRGLPHTKHEVPSSRGGSMQPAKPMTHKMHYVFVELLIVNRRSRIV